MAADTHCFVCNTAIEPDQPPIHIGATTVAQQHNTKHTGRSVFELLEEFLGYSLQAQRSATNRWCVECLERANEYDLAMQTARRCEAELVQVFNDTENAVTTNAAAEPEDVEDTVAAASDQLDDELWPLKIEELDENELEELEQFQNEQRLRDDENFDVDDDDNDEDFDQQSISAVYLSDEIGNAEEGYSEDKPDIVCDSPTKHPATILFKCTHCNADFETNGDFKVHIRACKASNRRAPLTCPTCGLPCHTRAALSIHMALHNGITPFECDACGKQFSHRGAMVRHMVLHTGVKAFQVKSEISDCRHVELNNDYFQIHHTVRQMRQTVHPSLLVPHAPACARQCARPAVHDLRPGVALQFASDASHARAQRREAVRVPGVRTALCAALQHDDALQGAPRHPSVVGRLPAARASLCDL